AYHPVTVSFGHIEDSGRFNIIGDTITAWGTIRCSVETDMTELQTRLRRLAEHTAQSYGCTATVEYLQPVPAVRNTPEWVEATLPTLRRVIGPDRVVQVPASLGYDDVSVFVNTFGGVYLGFGVQDTEIDNNELVPTKAGRGLVPNHNAAFYAADDALADSVRIHAHIAIDHLSEKLTHART
ncbi:MAG TPA: hypothetical protein VFP34_04825, partial [Microlunatus sp.]|nr:hypothetical protein [Microlunatus sp.]